VRTNKEIGNYKKAQEIFSILLVTRNRHMLKGNKQSQLENAKKHYHNSVTVKGENSEGAILSGILYAFYRQLNKTGSY
jgi:hypothetical protein